MNTSAVDRRTRLCGGGAQINRQRWIHTDTANIVFASVIVLNAIFIGVETDYSQQDSFDTAYYSISCFFFLTYLLELILRIEAERLVFFVILWNLIDFFIVIVTGLDLVLQIVFAESEIGGVSSARLLRLARLTRMFRLIRYFDQLSLLMRGFVVAIKKLFWVGILLIIILVNCGVFTTRFLGFSMAAENNEILKELWGSFGRSLFTLFELVTGEGWPDITRNTTDAIPESTPFFICFIVFCNVTLLSLITGIVVEQVLEVSSKHQYDSAKSIEAQNIDMRRQLKKAFKACSKSNNCLSKEEFMSGLQSDTVVKKLNKIDIAVTDPLKVFDILDTDRSGSLSEEEFVSGCMRFKGSSKTKHLVMVQYDLQKLRCETMASVQLMEVILRRIITRMDPGDQFALKNDDQLISHLNQTHLRATTEAIWENEEFTSTNLADSAQIGAFGQILGNEELCIPVHEKIQQKGSIVDEIDSAVTNDL
eukprot:GHVL01019656.1.p1 GENE.GHVL01019656.1~~GHVL01019656.1.p1  ORF type:complete len:479 (-),score=64.49 GHVL01019656.1:157-1593(-)